MRRLANTAPYRVSKRLAKAGVRIAASNVHAYPRAAVGQLACRGQAFWTCADDQDMCTVIRHL